MKVSSNGPTRSSIIIMLLLPAEAEALPQRPASLLFLPRGAGLPTRCTTTRPFRAVAPPTMTAFPHTCSAPTTDTATYSTAHGLSPCPRWAVTSRRVREFEPAAPGARTHRVEPASRIHVRHAKLKLFCSCLRNKQSERWRDRVRGTTDPSTLRSGRRTRRCAGAAGCLCHGEEALRRWTRPGDDGDDDRHHTCRPDDYTSAFAGEVTW